MDIGQSLWSKLASQIFRSNFYFQKTHKNQSKVPPDLVRLPDPLFWSQTCLLQLWVWWVTEGDTRVSRDGNQVARGRKSRDRMSWEVSGSKRMIWRFNKCFQVRRFILNWLFPKIELYWDLCLIYEWTIAARFSSQLEWGQVKMQTPP